MICVVIKGPSFEEAHKQITKALKYADLVELRLDCFTVLNLDDLRKLRARFSIPMIFTLRSPLEGGIYTKSEENRIADIRRLAQLMPEYLDIENSVPQSFFEWLSVQYPETKVILSYHNFSDTPDDLEGLYQEMQKTSAHFYKIAVTSQNCLDALRLISWAKTNSGKLIAISMGSHGQISRILGPVVGCPITYASLEDDQSSTLGQLSPKTLIERYHHHSLNACTTLYGLIGDPVDQSIGDETHNTLFSAFGLDAVYVKIQVKASELADFLQLAKELSFCGLSVTMPLKESILPFLDDIDPQAHEIGAVNTLLFDKGKIIGFNTDGIGALNAIEDKCNVKNRRIVIIGAGGATRAIAHEAHRRGAIVTIVNRNPEKAQQIARRIGCNGKGLEYMPACADEGYDILINCTPQLQPIHSDDILTNAVVMDIVTKPKETAILQVAQQKGCRVIYGYQMFVKQAVGQFNLWFKNRFDIPKINKILEKKAAECVSESKTDK